MCYFEKSPSKLDGHLMTFWWWSATTWWSWFWGFWSWFWVTIRFWNTAIWLVRTSIIRLTTWSTTWSLLSSLFIFKSWFVALNFKNIRIRNIDYESEIRFRSTFYNIEHLFFSRFEGLASGSKTFWAKQWSLSL